MHFKFWKKKTKKKTFSLSDLSSAIRREHIVGEFDYTQQSLIRHDTK